MDIQKAIKDIKDFRKANKGKCVSTSHDFTTREFTKIRPELTKRFKKFEAEFDNTKVKVTIAMFGRRI